MKMAEAFQLAGLEGKAARMASCGNVLIFNVMELGYHLALAQFLPSEVMSNVYMETISKDR
ncbi:hypothetical protein GCM10020331_091800 [Ectobacillus funiculus]